MDGTQEFVVTLTRWTVGPGEMLELEHVDSVHRYAEAMAFYYWFVSYLVLEQSSYEFKTDYLRWTAEALTSRLPRFGVIIDKRMAEYSRGVRSTRPAAPAITEAAGRMFRHIDPTAWLDPELITGMAEAADSWITLFADVPRWE